MQQDSETREACFWSGLNLAGQVMSYKQTPAFASPATGGRRANTVHM